MTGTSGRSTWPCLVRLREAIGKIAAAFLVSEINTAFFWGLLYLPVGSLALLAGWQLIKIARALAAASSDDRFYDVGEFAKRLRLALVFAGSMCLVLLFIALSSLLFWRAFTP